MGHPRTVAAVALAVLQLVVLVSLVGRGPEPEPRGAPVAVAAPPVVGAAVVDLVDALPGRPLVARTASGTLEARAAVAGGEVVAAVVVDLREDTDVLYVAGANGSDLNDSVRALVDDVEGRFDRTVVQRDVVPTRAGDTDAADLARGVGLCVLLGVALAVVITWRRGPVADTVRGGVRRLVLVGAVAAAVGLPVALVASSTYGTGPSTWWLVVWLTVVAAAAVTLALESVFGVLGIGVATALLVLSAAPLVGPTSTWLLPAPWAAVTPWLPHGAALEAARSEAYLGGATARPLAVLALWVVLAVTTLVAARRERARDAVEAAGSVAT